MGTPGPSAWSALQLEQQLLGNKPVSASKMAFVSTPQPLDAEKMAGLMAATLAGQVLTDSEEMLTGPATSTEMLLVGKGPTPDSFLLWNGEGQLFQVTVKECPEG